MPLRPLFVASLGNPGRIYSDTLHSAGHTILNIAQSQWLHSSPFGTSRPYAKGLISFGPHYVLWQSPSLMNVSGRSLGIAWRSFLSSFPVSKDKSRARLVVVHDELELPIGKIKIKDSKASPKGHNGLKSVFTALPELDFTRIGVGIGRPKSRESGDVAAYVLRKMTESERKAMIGVAGQVAEVVRNMGQEG